jgi:hypothetical protein
MEGFCIGIDFPLQCSGVCGGSGSLSALLSMYGVTPVNPRLRMCEICKMKPASGSVGSLTDPHFEQWVCEICYKHVLKMRPLSEIVKENELKALSIRE